VRVVIDDFGTGYSSLYHLYELRFDKLKIDRRFIQKLVITGESKVFIRAMVGLSKGLNLLVTAEGIETEAQAAAALAHGASIRLRDSCSARRSRRRRCLPRRPSWRRNTAAA
jgi:EAL domain-containing protein (putative c-di-GMP-specific phosphodiesterase class I)